MDPAKGSGNDQGGAGIGWFEPLRYLWQALQGGDLCLRNQAMPLRRMLNQAPGGAGFE
jgi:hypothetical protein